MLVKTLPQILLCAALAGSAQVGPIQDLDRFSQAAESGLSAYRSHDWRTAELAFARAYRIAPQRALALYYFAASAARLGESARAIGALDRFATFGTGTELDPDHAFAAMEQSPRMVQIRAKFARRTAARCACRVLFEGKAAAFIAESPAYDAASGRLFVSGVSPRKIVALRGGREQDFAMLPDGLSPFGMRVDARRKLIWAAAASMAQSQGARKGERGRSALLAYDLADGRLRLRYDAPPLAGGRALNDVALGPDGSVYASDANDGSIFRLAPEGTALRPVCALGVLKSPQGMVVGAAGRTLLVADYAAGLVTLDLPSCKVRQLGVPDGVTTLTMDGLVQLADGSFAATQNGIHPARLVHFRLSADWRRIVSFAVSAQGPGFLDPTLLAAHGTKVLAITGSQWASFDDGPDPVRPLSNWRIVVVSFPISVIRKGLEDFPSGKRHLA